MLLGVDCSQLRGCGNAKTREAIRNSSKEGLAGLESKSKKDINRPLVYCDHCRLITACFIFSLPFSHRLLNTAVPCWFLLTH
jgi:hypothetical protein